LLKTVGLAALFGVAAFVLTAPATAKGPPAGKGGPPPWAGGGGSNGGKAAGQKVKGPEHPSARGLKKAAGKGAKNRAKGRGDAKQNPAMTCFGLLAEQGEAFYEKYGTNPNGANAFGKCVSEQARKRGGDGEQEPPEGEPEDPAECEAPAEDEEPAEDLSAELAVLTVNTPVEDGCEPTDEDPGESPGGEDEPDADEDAEAEGPAALTCFAPAPARGSPFAVCA
jgi:hypothetical protein